MATVDKRALAVVAVLALLIGNPLTAQSADSVSPPHRRHHALAYDPASGRVFLAGGQHLVSSSETPVLEDLWSWDGLRWTQIAAHTGIPMITHKLYADRAGNLFAVFSRGLVARWDARRWTVVTEDSASRRESAAGAFDSDRHRYVSFGGLVGGRAYDTTGETWEFDGMQWTRVATTGPPPMLGGAMAYDDRRQVMVLFGGLDTLGQKLPDTWVWDGREWRISAVAPAPPARSEGYLAYDEARDVMVLFGGEGSAVVPTLGDTWEWDGTRWKNPRPRQ